MNQTFIISAHLGPWKEPDGLIGGKDETPASILLPFWTRTIMAGRRRSWQRVEEQRMRMAREADWLAATTGQQLIQRGRFWGR